MRDRDYTSQMVVKAVKGRDPGGRPRSLNFGGKSYAFGPKAPGQAIDLWTAWAAGKLKSMVRRGPVALVPVPNSTAVHGTSPDFPTAALAGQVAQAIGPRVAVATELWWDQEMERASDGGPRYAQDLFPHLVAEVSSAPGPRILLDDVLTSGGHLKACAAKLREAGHDPQFAICCGRTCHEQLENPFVVPIVELPDFDPGNPWGFSDVFVEDFD